MKISKNISIAFRLTQEEKDAVKHFVTLLNKESMSALMKDLLKEKGILKG